MSLNFLNLNKNKEMIGKTKYSQNNLSPNRIKIKYSNQLDLEINKIWSKFIKAFDYEKFYSEKMDSNGKYKSQDKSEMPSKITIIKLLTDFFTQNRILYSDDYNLIPFEGKEINMRLNHNQNESVKQKQVFSFIVKNSKIWMMYIVIMSNNLKINETILIFKHALNNGVDAILMFEFFLIFISKQTDEYITSKSLNLIEDMPREFLNIYKGNKKLLNSLFPTKNKNLTYNCNYSYVDSDTEMHPNHDHETDIYSFEEFSFYTHNKENLDFAENFHFSNSNSKIGKIDLDLENEEKLKTVIQDDSQCLNEILQDEMIDNTRTKLIEKSPSNLIFNMHKGRKSSDEQNFCNSRKNSESDNSPLFFNKSPTLDSYLLPNRDKSQSKSDQEVEETFPSQNMNFNLESALENASDYRQNQKSDDDFYEDEEDCMDIDVEIDEQNLHEECHTEKSKLSEEQAKGIFIFWNIKNKLNFF